MAWGQRREGRGVGGGDEILLTYGAFVISEGFLVKFLPNAAVYLYYRDLISSLHSLPLLALLRPNYDMCIVYSIFINHNLFV